MRFNGTTAHIVGRPGVIAHSCPVRSNTVCPECRFLDESVWTLALPRSIPNVLRRPTASTLVLTQKGQTARQRGLPRSVLNQDGLFLKVLKVRISGKYPGFGEQRRGEYDRVGQSPSFDFLLPSKIEEASGSLPRSSSNTASLLLLRMNSNRVPNSSASLRYFSNSSATTVVGVTADEDSRNPLTRSPAAVPEKYSTQANESRTTVSRAGFVESAS